MTLTKTFDAHVFERALESWSWVGLEGKQALFASLFGHVFLESGNGCWWLDVERGLLERRWDDRRRMEADLASEEGEDEFLLAGLAKAAEATGLKLSDDQIYDFWTPPVLGGEYAVENLRAARFEVAIDLLGQIHEQLRDLPDGTDVRIELERHDSDEGA